MKNIFPFATLVALMFCMATQANSQNFYEVMVAAQNGNADAMYQVARMFKSEGDTVEAQVWMAKAADKGSVDAQVVMAYVSQNKEDHKQAFYWMSKAAAQGDAEAEYELGTMYMEGLGVKMDTVKGMQLWTRSAEKDYGDALLELAYYYEKRDPQRARELAERALGHAKLSGIQRATGEMLLYRLK